MANRFSTTIRRDQTVVASQVPANIAYMDLDSTGRINVYWLENTPYIARGKKHGP